jgi:hypothetical protein
MDYFPKQLVVFQEDLNLQILLLQAKQIKI